MKSIISIIGGLVFGLLFTLSLRKIKCHKHCANEKWRKFGGCIGKQPGFQGYFLQEVGFQSYPKTKATYIVKLNIKSIISIIGGCVLGLLFGGGWGLGLLFEGTRSFFSNYAQVKNNPKPQPTIIETIDLRSSFTIKVGWVSGLFLKEAVFQGYFYLQHNNKNPTSSKK